MSSSAADKLTPQQRLFCQEYIVDSNAYKAYLAAGYKAKSRSIADSSASKLLRLPKIQAYIAELLENKRKASEVTAERIVKELAAIAFHRSKKTTTIKDGIATVIDSDDWDEESSAAVQEVSGEAIQTTGDDGGSLVAKRLKVKTYDKVRALELLSKINGLTSDLPMAIATLKNYGIVLKRDPETNRFYVE